VAGATVELATLRKQFGSRVRRIREDMDKSQEQFAELVGMSVDFLSLIERGRNSPSFGKLERMAKALGRPVSFFFIFDSYPKQKNRKTSL
jgi:transcriptional regulator with XRE-family HTH domain